MRSDRHARALSAKNVTARVLTITPGRRTSICVARASRIPRVPPRTSDDSARPAMTRYKKIREWITAGPPHPIRFDN